MTSASGRFAPQTLFGRTVLAIALVSVTFQLFTLATIFYFVLLPLGRHATDDFAALMLSSAQTWHAAAADQRAALDSRLLQTHRLRVTDAPVATGDFTRRLPYFHFLESSLSAQAGQPIRLEKAEADGSTWYWARLPVAQPPGSINIGFPASRVTMQPSAVLLIVLGTGALVTFLTGAWLARWLVGPLARLANAAQKIGQGQRPALLPEAGPAELAALVREFNRMGEQVEELLANRTTLLAGISHDLRSPLARIQLALGMLTEDPDPALVEHVLRDVEGMNALIGRCLEVSQDFAEKDTLDVDLCDVLREVAIEFALSGAEIRGHRGPDCHLRVRPLALKRILANLVDNAQRYGDGQPIDIEYDIAADHVEIRVLDRGPGIPADEREKIFRPFYRLEQSRSTRTGGSGLGLAIVRQLATANGWTVDLAARAGGGTAATVRIPLDGKAAT